MTDTEIVREAEAHLKTLDNDIYHPITSHKSRTIIQRLLDVVKGREWELISIKECGCQLRRSNKMNYFVDSCDKCTNLPPKPEAGGE